MGAPDALKLAPDPQVSCAESSANRASTERCPSDARLASGAARHALENHRMHHTGRAQGTVRGSGVCCARDTTHRTHNGRVQCCTRCTSSQIFNKVFRSTFTQLSSNSKKTQVSTNWNWNEWPLLNPQVFHKYLAIGLVVFMKIVE